MSAIFFRTIIHDGHEFLFYGILSEKGEFVMTYRCGQCGLLTHLYGDGDESGLIGCDEAMAARILSE